jgi:signal transduction histidine kinase
MFHAPGSSVQQTPASADGVHELVVTALDVAQCGVAIVEGDAVVFCTDALTGLCDGEPREVAAIIERLEPETRPAVRAALGRRTGMESVQGVWTRPDGARLGVEIQVIGMDVGGRVVHGMLVRSHARFVSGVRQRNFAAGSARNVQHELVVSASHALRTPLTALMLHLQCMQRAFDRPDLDRAALARRVEKALMHIQQLTDLVNQLLDASTAAEAGEV